MLLIMMHNSWQLLSGRFMVKASGKKSADFNMPKRIEKLLLGNVLSGCKIAVVCLFAGNPEMAQIFCCFSADPLYQN